MKRLPYDFSRCENQDCIDRFNCARFTDKPSGVRLPISSFTTPQKSGECPFFLLNTTEDK